MKINESKSKIMIFNKSKKYDFPPEFSFSNGKNLEVLEETRLLGVVLTTDLRWASNTKSIYTKAMSKMWLLRRMIKLKLHTFFNLSHNPIRKSLNWPVYKSVPYPQSLTVLTVYSLIYSQYRQNQMMYALRTVQCDYLYCYLSNSGRRGLYQLILNG